jgi:uncharacterized protein
VIFDAHTHWSDGWRSDDPTDPARWLAVWDKYGVTAGLLFPMVGLEDSTRLRQDNDHVSAIAARSSGRMIPFCTVAPNAGEDAIRELSRCHHELKMRGLKLHPWLQGCTLASPTMDRLCEAAAEYRMPVIFHDGTPCFSLPSQVAVLARRHPRTTFLLGHCGIFQHWREAIAAMRYSENLWGCLCSPYAAALRQLVGQSDLSRLLWGSDHGFGSIDMIGYRLELMECVGLTPRQRDMILWENAGRIFDLPKSCTTGESTCNDASS